MVSWSAPCWRRSSAVRPRGEDGEDTTDCPWWIAVCSVFSSPPPVDGWRTERALRISLFSLSVSVSVSPSPMPLPKRSAAKSGALVTFFFSFFFFAATANVSFTTLRPVKSGGWHFYHPTMAKQLSPILLIKSRSDVWIIKKNPFNKFKS